MIEKLTLRNFQCHEKYTLELDPHLTCVVGGSDQGKTSILRAIRWALYNEPSGEAFISHGSESCSVSVYIDGRKIIRKRDKGVNTYSLDGETYKAFRDGIPEAISNLANVDPSLNFQGQLEFPFWFLKTPGEVSRELNKIVNLDRIDSVLAAVASDIRQARAVADVTRDRLAASVRERDALEWVVECNQDWQEIERVQKDIILNRTRIASLLSLVGEVAILASRVQIAAEANLDALALLSLVNTIEESRSRLDSLRDLIRELEEGEKQCTELQERITSAVLDEEVCSTCGRKF